ncbi:uncharacterized protein EI90DRAFT_3120960 [Cantharellus anzutake]|uniref:uncharacterized protein n=1 Tax=Cantharellus anzutake TaxID=1750568 RepID=UPI0019068599|nr:uncharacterized protein EI90DRAFT_3120960 [Cantharellus anzutake]KAF8335070.1 hypothetical protein EI90DRAFT_3120960 [Cantharellus anzutake]
MAETVAPLRILEPPMTLPPRSYIVLADNIVAEKSAESDVLVAGDFDPRNPKVEQAFHIFPDGKICHSDGKFTAPQAGMDNHGIELVDASRAFRWRILWSAAGCRIHHTNGKAWTFTQGHTRIEVKGRVPREGQLVSFIAKTSQPAAPSSTSTSTDSDGDDDPGPIYPQAADKIIVTGVRSGPLFPAEPGPQLPSGDTLRPRPIPARLEIREFIKNEKMFSLYVQALKKLQKTPEDKMASYYQVCGLHGLPLVPWNQSGGEGVYCRHASPLFPTWHRAYVVLFEQLIHEHALEIAQKYREEGDKWLNAATDLRQPFWDWARDGGAVPPELLLSRQTVRIITPAGPRHVENPFLYYAFRTGYRSTGTFPTEHKEWTRTIRHPYSDTPNKDIRDRMAKAQKQLTEQTYKLFHINNWEDFSNKGQTDLGATNSLEAIHDSIHLHVGRLGHFAGPCGAFDPMFYLHHSQIDRLLSLWKTLHEDQWVHLTPFWNSERSYWSSDLMHSHEVFNYTYPEYQGAAEGDLQVHIRNKVDSLYATSTVQLFKGISQNSSLTSWSIRFRIKPFAIDQSFSVVVFLNQLPKDPQSWFTSKDLVGTYDVFVTYLPKDCENCRSHENIPIQGFVDLTSAVRNLSPDMVEDYLREGLHLGLQRVDGTLVDLGEPGKRTELGFNAEVVSRVVTLEPTSEDHFDFRIGKGKYRNIEIKSGDLFFPKL